MIDTPVRKVITKKGLTLISKLQAGQKMRFTAIQTGNGVHDDDVDLKCLTALKAHKQTVPVSSVVVVDSCTVKVRGVLNNKDLSDSYFCSEIGVFANDPDEGEILYSLLAFDEPNIIRKPSDAGDTEEVLLSIFITVGNAANITIIIGQSTAYATAADLEDHIHDPYAHDLRQLIELSTAETPAPGTRLHMKILCSVPNWVTPVYDQLPEAAGIQPAMLQIEGIGEVEGYLALDDGSMKRMVLQTT